MAFVILKADYWPHAAALKPPTPEHARFAAMLVNEAALMFVDGDDPWLEHSQHPPDDPFFFNSPLFALLSPHLQLELIANVSRWMLCSTPTPPAALGIGHRAALWAMHSFFIAPLELETDEC